MQKGFGSLVIDLIGTELQPEERELIAHPLVGGIILFSRNYESLAQLKQLTQAIRQVKNKPLLIMVDQEGGRVQRFKEEFTRIPPAAVYGQQGTKALELAAAGGYVMAIELLAAGIDLSLAPILDLNKGVSAIIGDRSFHSDPYEAIKLINAFINGMKQAGMAATGKHFPGHGSVAPDSHLELPIDHRSWDEIVKEDLQPFVYFIRNKIPALMTAHIAFPAVDEMPVSFSHHWLTEILRDQLHFEGVVMSDDLDMKGAASMGDYAARMRAACEAGCDIILLCNNRPAVIQVLDHIPYESYLLDQSKYEMLRGQFALDLPLTQNIQWKKNRELIESLNNSISSSCQTRII
ncbi:MAG TPA: beta-N-acetylhexosaminidase [Gammaproteobacteria bacterium]|nr:beta-N-acetylhexosaminidase [Gammaproteobacteria bacterium]